MKFRSGKLVIKLSVSDMLESAIFYTKVLGLIEDPRYTINSGGNYGTESYMQLNFPDEKIPSLGLYKDIENPYQPPPQTGTVPSFIVADIESTLAYLKKHKVKIVGEDEKSIIITNRSDEGYVDKFFFFLDPDNNSLVIRQDFGKMPKDDQ